MSLTQFPPYKILIKQFKSVSPAKSSANNESYKSWLVEFFNNDWESSKAEEVQVTNVWIQGTIIQSNEDILFVNDGTGLAVVAGSQKLSYNSKKLQIGDFVMVIGYVTHAGNVPVNPAWNFNYSGSLELLVRLQAIKVTVTGNNSLLSKGIWWTKEVQDAQKHVKQTLSR